MKKSIKKAMLRIEMPNGSIWAVPVEIIAYHRAQYYAERDEEFDGDIIRSLNEDTWPLFESDEHEIIDWAANNMDWENVEDEAFLIEKPKSEYQKGWTNGNKEIVYDD